MKEHLAECLCARVFVSVFLFFSYLFQPVCNKCDSSPAVDCQSPSNGRPNYETYSQYKYGVCGKRGMWRITSRWMDKEMALCLEQHGH